ncbi:hypothetical protein JANAI62_36550 [Jannaschia pagri]|uniref:SnoaL-like domain-containing protein n=1 Tax=Jannaschia pagri TaxID=2829797 RepID=A0ABQ4NSD2_9RHOB|nr:MULTISPECIES: hypothetical protein [unclassified Jannaschia]GIT93201.1 hypothetical protein JANAI61_36590 [Jannaschia sp. AI_61]GIT97032.1 hypothetical protein JANAI62_36550 [Jannaschia sp. AI_62]
MAPHETPSTAPALWPRLAALTVVLGLAGAGALWLTRPAAPQALPAPGLAAPVDADGLRGQGYGVTIAILGTVYEAFAQTEETAIYDGLATVAAGEALESLYLERAGALATGGLPDQVVHELTLTDGTWRTADGAMTATIRWAVLGEVGHAEHTHMRGNAYGAELTIAPADGAWRLTDFRLTDVDRTEAGTLTTVPGGDAPDTTAEVAPG